MMNDDSNTIEISITEPEKFMGLDPLRNVWLVLSLKGGMIVVSAIDIIAVAIAIGIAGLMAS